MNRNRSVLQLFAAPENLTGNAQIQVRAREIDFVSTFGKDMSALLEILGISRMIKKANGTVLKVKKASGKLQDGKVAEGEIIPLSQYNVEEVDFDSISIEKYRKGVSLEAIAEKGYEAAVEMTDEEFKADLRNVVMDKFYSQLKMGSLTGHETTWQMAVSMAIGRVKDKFKKIRKSTTGIAVWVNTLDLYKYLGGAQITVQQAFGLDYVKNFLGADVMFISSDIPENVVIATPFNNLAAYYVDPADSEFVKAGLSYTVDSETGFIGFHAQGTYERAISDMFAIMGLRLFAEYLDAIAYISVGSSDTQTLGTLTVKSVEGEYAGTTDVSVETQKASINNTYKIKVAASATSVTYGQNVKAWTAWDAVSPIEAAAGNHVTVVEADADYKAVRYGDVVAVVKAAATTE